MKNRLRSGPKKLVALVLLLWPVIAQAQLPVADPIMDTTLVRQPGGTHPRGANPRWANPRRANPRWVAKFAFMTLFDADNTIQFGLERLLNARHSVQGEFGYGWEGLSLYPDRRERFDRFETWRGRSEWRLYSSRYRAQRGQRPPLGRYFAVDAFFKQLTVRDEFSVGRDCANGNCAYFERMDLPAMKYTWGAHAKIGRQFAIDFTDANRLVMDFYFGLGFRSRRIRLPSLPENGTLPFQNSFNLFDPFNGSRSGEAIPSLALGFKLGYVL